MRSSTIARSIAAAIVLVFFVFVLVATSDAQTPNVAVSGNVKDLGGASCGSGCEVRARLYNCGDNAPKSGGVLIGKASKSFTVDPSTGAFSGAMYGNDQITCGGILDATRYYLGVYVNGKLQFTEQRYHVTGNSFNPANVQAETDEPPPSTNDYAIRNGDNAFKGTQDFSQANVVGVPREASMNVESLTPADSGKFQLKFPVDVDLDRISCSTDTGTASINFEIRVEATPGATGASVLSVPVTCTPSTGTASAFDVARVPAESPLALTVSSTSGTPGVVRVHLQYKPN